LAKPRKKTGNHDRKRRIRPDRLLGMQWETVDLASEIDWKHFNEFEDENRY
tara:strand:+ start:408 stop:560 length:153 start_codon:yes stop_codon:yes gene_type:complete